MNNGKGVELRAADAYEIDPRHDAEVIGRETYVGPELKNADEMAKSVVSSK